MPPQLDRGFVSSSLLLALSASDQAFGDAVLSSGLQAPFRHEPLAAGGDNVSEASKVDSWRAKPNNLWLHALALEGVPIPDVDLLSSSGVLGAEDAGGLTPALAAVRDQVQEHGQGLSRFEFLGVPLPGEVGNVTTSHSAYWRDPSAASSVSSTISATISSTLSSATTPALRSTSGVPRAAGGPDDKTDYVKTTTDKKERTMTSTTTTTLRKWSGQWWWQEEDILVHFLTSAGIHIMMCFLLWGFSIGLTFPCFPVMMLPPEFRAFFFVLLSSAGAFLLATEFVVQLDRVHAALGIVSWWLQLLFAWLLASWSFPMVLAVTWSMGSGNCIESLDILFPYLIIFEVRDIYFSLLCRCRGRSAAVCVLKVFLVLPGLLLIPTFMMVMAFFWCCSEVCICTCGPCVWIKDKATERRIRYDRDSDGSLDATKQLSTRAYIGRPTVCEEDGTASVALDSSSAGRRLLDQLQRGITRDISRELFDEASPKASEGTPRRKSRAVHFEGIAEEDGIELPPSGQRSKMQSVNGVVLPPREDDNGLVIPSWKFASPRRFSSSYGGVPDEEKLDVFQKLIVLSVRSATSTSPFLSFMLDLVHHHEDLTDCRLCNPNTACASFCGPPDKFYHEQWPCRGECYSPATTPNSIAKTPYGLGFDPKQAPCWRSCFKRYLERAHASSGCMLQIVERASCDKGDYSGAIEYGGGQDIEELLADDVGIKVFTISMPELAACVTMQSLVDQPPSQERQAVDAAFNDFVDDFNTWSERTSFPTHWGGLSATGEGDSFSAMCKTSGADKSPRPSRA